MLEAELQTQPVNESFNAVFLGEGSIGDCNQGLAHARFYLPPPTHLKIT